MTFGNMRSKLKLAAAQRLPNKAALTEDGQFGAKVACCSAAKPCISRRKRPSGNVERPSFAVLRDVLSSRQKAQVQSNCSTTTYAKLSPTFARKRCKTPRRNQSTLPDFRSPAINPPSSPPM
jgi:hypothetical protein